jgi:hypothetical protein
VSQHPPLTSDEQKLGEVWDENLRAEFEARRVNETFTTMVAQPRASIWRP